MGSSGSKQNAVALSSSSSSPSSVPSSSSSCFVRRTRSYRSRVFQSSCLRSRLDLRNGHSEVSEYQTQGNAVYGPCANETKPVADAENSECHRKVKIEQPGGITCVTSELENDEWGQTRGGCMSSRALNPSSHFLSRLSFFPGNVSFRLRRANSSNSARPDFTSSTRFAMSNNAGGPSPSRSMIDGHDGAQNDDLFPPCFSNLSPRSEHQDLAIDHLREMTSSQGRLSSRVDAGIDCDGNPSSTHHEYSEGVGARLANGRIVAGETVERNVQFSRTLSVGRLRDRVLRRTSFTDLDSSPFQQDREARHFSRASERQALGAAMGRVSSEENTFSSPTSLAGPSSSLYGSHEAEASRPRGTRYHDLLEYRSNFLERRRRIRSQVHALQHLGSRFENLSGHERICILSGQHRRGRCTCRINAREAESNNETSARASISRIVMLAEALFEVLDEIHQQSVVLSSQPSMSSMGSVPAPNEVVESLPLRSYSKVQKHLHDEAAQCYICLVEYEEGDSVRILPCHHEYHKTCIDKWLKEIHRVCPLCRGDVCRSDSLPVEV